MAQRMAQQQLHRVNARHTASLINPAVSRVSCRQFQKAAKDKLNSWTCVSSDSLRACTRADSICCSASIVDVEVSQSPETPERERLSDIQFTDERRPKSNLLLSFTVPAARCMKAWDKALKTCGKNLQVPGFRPGKKLPENVVIKEMGRDTVVGEAISRIMDSCFSLITEKYKEQAFSDSIQILTEEDLINVFSKDKDFKFQASIDLYPTIAWTGDYRDLKVQVLETSNEEADQEACKERIWAALKQKGKLRIANRGLEKGDVAIIDFSARRADNGEAIAGSEKRGMQVDTIDQAAIFGIAGIVDALNGKVPGDTVRGTFEVADSWWGKGDGLTALDCTADIKEVLTWDVPELSDEIAKEILPGCSSVDDLWTQLIEAQRSISKADLAQNVNSALLKAVADIVETEVPEYLVMDMAEKEYQQRLLQYQSSGRLDKEAIEQLATPEMLSQYFETQYPELEYVQKGVLGMQAIFTTEGLTVPEDEMRSEAESVIAEAKEAKQELDEERLMEQIYETLKAQKVLEFLVDESQIDIIKAPEPAELEEASSATSAQ